MPPLSLIRRPFARLAPRFGPGRFAAFPRAGRVRATAFTPLSVTGFNSGVFPALALAAGGLWQNSGKTTAVTADGELTRVVTCPFAAVDFAAASDAARPEYNTDGTYHWLAFDGTDDALLRTVSLPQPWWFFSASQIGVAGGTISDGHTTNAGYTARAAGNPATYQMFAPSLDVLTNNFLAPDVTALFGGVFNGASSSAYLNGEKTTGTVGAMDLTGVTVGSRSGVPSEKCDKLFALCFGTGVPSDAEFESLRVYFADFAPP